MTCGLARRKTLKMMIISSSPSAKPMIGELMSGTSTLSRTPGMFHEPGPAAAAAAPSRPPISAWLLELGMPSRHVNRFQKMAPISAAATTETPSTLVATIPAPTVLATAVPVSSAPTKFATALIAIAHCGFSARVLTLVAMAFAVSWKPLM